MSRFVALGDLTSFRDEKLQKCSVFETERMFCDVYCLRPGQAQKAHSHADSDKIYVVLEGQVVVRVATEERTLSIGWAAHSAPGEEHSLLNPGPDNARVLVFLTPKPRH